MSETAARPLTSIDLSEIRARIVSFKQDLGRLSDTNIVQKNITYGPTYILPNNGYFALKQAISQKLSLHHSEVILVGSGKLGFSIAPEKRYEPFGDDSDLDVAIVSGRLFDNLWYRVFEHRHKNKGRYWTKEKRFKDYLFKGWLRPDYLPSSIPETSDWFEFFRELTESMEFGPYKISGGIYKSWKYLESYQQTAVTQCRNTLYGGLQ